MTDTRTTEELVAIVKEAAFRPSSTRVNWQTFDAALDTLTERLEAYEAEHEAATAYLRATRQVHLGAVRGRGEAVRIVDAFITAYHHAERVRRGE